MNECKLNKDICGNNSNCINTQGSFVCECKEGYEGTPPSCES